MLCQFVGWPEKCQSFMQIDGRRSAPFAVSGLLPSVYAAMFMLNSICLG